MSRRDPLDWPEALPEIDLGLDDDRVGLLLLWLGRALLVMSLTGFALAFAGQA